MLSFVEHLLPSSHNPQSIYVGYGLLASRSSDCGDVVSSTASFPNIFNGLMFEIKGFRGTKHRGQCARAMIKWVRLFLSSNENFARWPRWGYTPHLGTTIIASALLYLLYHHEKIGRAIHSCKHKRFTERLQNYNSARLEYLDAETVH